MVILQGILAPHESLAPFINRVQLLAGDIDLYRRGELTEEDLYARYGKFNINSYALLLLPFEQQYTPNLKTIEQTDLLKAIAASPLLPILKHLASYRLGYGTPEIRISFPLETHLHQGGLRSHIEHRSFPGSHVMWMPLMPVGQKSNVDTPGVGFMVRSRGVYEHMNDTLARANNMVEELAKLTPDKHTEDDIPVSHGDFVRITPHVQTGDVIIFDSMVPHFSYFPKEARFPRISYDMRLFPEALQSINETTRQIRESACLKL